jgi:hypothetical protein
MEADKRGLPVGTELILLGPPLPRKVFTGVVLVIRNWGGRLDECDGQDVVDLAPQGEQYQEVGEPFHLEFVPSLKEDDE